MSDKFYVIRMIMKNGERGYVQETPQGIGITLGGVDAKMKIFYEFDHATQYIRQNRLENRGNRAYVVSNEDLLEEGESGLVSAEEAGLQYYIENGEGKRLYAEPAMEIFYFKHGTVGFCCWDKESAEKFAEIIREEKKEMQVFVKALKDLIK